VEHRGTVARLRLLYARPMTEWMRTGRPALLIAVGIWIVLIAAGCALADSSPGTAPDATRVLASGEATVSAEPDRVRISLGIDSEAQSAEAAVRDNAQRVSSVRGALAKAFGDTAQISGAGYSLNPKYRYVKGKGQALEHYAAASRIEVVLVDVKAAGRVVDVATQAGANNVQGVQFEIADPAPLRDRALRGATLAARAKAESIAASLDMQLLRVVRVSESGLRAGPTEAFGMRVAMAQSAPTTIAASSVRVHARVEMEVEAGR
jgi:uncharacterized protein YggE